ncbi:RNA polymerase sigma factor [Pricia sp.]|uniref:RNA polymerase sigma factor n=1 Tax=Pricia sp. TaxID=2268138 RepID=UPI00359331B8
MDNQAVEDLRSDDRLKLKALYNQYRAEFLGFGKRYNLDQDALADVYQEAFLALRKRAINGKLGNIQSSLKTYLFGIGKHMIFDALKEKNRNVSYESNMHLVGEEIAEIELDAMPPLTQEQSLLRKYFKELGEKCRQVLTLFYYRGLNIEEIAQAAGYGNANVVKAQKSRCLKTLRQLINS